MLTVNVSEARLNNAICTLQDPSEATTNAIEVSESKLISQNNEGNHRHDEKEKA